MNLSSFILCFELDSCVANLSWVWYKLAVSESNLEKGLFFIGVFDPLFLTIIRFMYPI